MATTIETVQTSYINFTDIVAFQKAVNILGLELSVERPRYIETIVVTNIKDFKKAFDKEFMEQLVSEGSDQFILAYTGE